MSSPRTMASSAGMTRSRVSRSRVLFFSDGTRRRAVDAPRAAGIRSPHTSIETCPERAPVAVRVSSTA